jgi:O-antigen/teichoic acid export membrane protein
LGSGISFLAVIVFSRELGAGPLGVYYPFIALLGLLSILANFGLRTATEKRISEGDDVEVFLGSAIILKSALLFLVVLAVLPFRGYINQYIGEEAVALFILALLAKEMSELSLFVLRGELRTDETALVESVYPVCWLSIGIILYMNNFGVKSLIIAHICGLFIMGIIGWKKVSLSPQWPDVEHIKSILDYGKYSVISAVGGYFYSWLDVIILTLFVILNFGISRQDIGAYENAWRLTMITMFLSQSIATTIFPQFSQWDSEDTIEKVESVIPTVIFPALLPVIPGFVGILVLSEDILEILFGTEFTVAAAALIILAAEKILQSVHVVLGRSLQAINYPDLAAYATVVSICINLILNIILIWYLGIVGAAIATTVSFAANTLLHMRFLSRFIDIRFPISKISWSVISSIIMGVIIYQYKVSYNVSNIVHLLAIVVVGGIIYTLLLLLYTPIRISFKKKIM